MTAQPEVPVKDVSRLPVYSSELRALLEAKLHDAWAELSLTMTPAERACSHGGRPWEVRVRSVPEGPGHVDYYRTQIYLGDIDVCGGEARTAPEADRLALSALREQCAKARPRCRDRSLVTEMTRLAEELHALWVNEGEPDTWERHSLKTPVSPWEIHVTRAGGEWIMTLHHQRTRKLVSVIRRDFQRAVREVLSALSEAHPEDLSPEMLERSTEPPETFPERALREFKQMFPDPGLSHEPSREFEYLGCKWRLEANPLPRLDGSFVTRWRVKILQSSTQRYWSAEDDDCGTAFNNALRRWALRVQDDTPKASAFATGLPGGPDWKNQPWFRTSGGTNIHAHLEERLKTAGVDVRVATGWLCEAIDMEKKASAAGDEACVVEGSTGSTWAMRVEREHSTWAFQLTRRGAGGRSWRALGVTYWQAFWNAAEAVGKDSDLPFSDDDITATIKRDCKRASGTNRLTPGAKHMLGEAGVNLDIAADWMKRAAEMYPVAVETGGKRSQACGWSLAVWRSGDEWQFTIERSQVSVVAKDRGYWAAFWAAAVKVGKVSQAYTGVGLATGSDKTVAVTMAVDVAGGAAALGGGKPTVQTYTAGTHDKRNLDPDRIMAAFKSPPTPLSPDQAMALGQQFLAEFGKMQPTPEGQETMQARRVGGANSCRVRLCVYEYGNVMAAVMRGVDEIGRANAAKGGKTDDRIAYAKEQAVMAAVQKLSEGYEPPSLEEVSDAKWHEHPGPRAETPLEYWPASDHGGSKYF